MRARCARNEKLKDYGIQFQFFWKAGGQEV